MTSQFGLLLVDFQRSFIDGNWAKHFGGKESMDDIQNAANNVASLFESGILRNVPILTTKCYLESPDADPPSILTSYFQSLPWVWKPTMDVTEKDEFHNWLHNDVLQQGITTLVIGGCTTTSCIRVSSQTIHKKYKEQGLEVVVDLSLCGARAENYVISSASSDPLLRKIYGELVDTTHAVDLAIHQMKSSGVVVVSQFIYNTNRPSS